MKKRICVGLPCFNEKDNIMPLYEELVAEFENHLPEYDYILQFIDNCSTDGTQLKIEELCKKTKKVRAIFNGKNFGPDRSASYNFCQMSDADCVILMTTDFQTPVEMISEFVHEWEKGALIVAGIKKKAKENKVMYAIRKLYYSLIQKFSDIEQIEQFTGFGLYDKKFVDFFKNFEDPFLNLRGLVAEYGYDVKLIPFEQPKRRAGKSKSNFYYLFDLAMYNFTTYTKIGLRLATFLGCIISILSFIVAIFYFILKIIYWNNFSLGIAPVIIGVFFLGALQLFFLGLLGEYIMSINTRILCRPRVIEKKRINFEHNTVGESDESEEGL